jgi:hypothetical protein
MSNTSKLVTVGVVVVAALGAWWYMSAPSQTGTPEQAAGNPSAQTGTQNTSGSSAISASASTDASLQQDASSIDTQISGLNSDAASADQGLSSQ